MGIVVPETIRALIAEKLVDIGLELYEIHYIQAGKRGSLRITIDSPAGVTVGDCEKASRDISLLLDVEEFSPGRPFNLEISSPGIDRQLKTERDFRRITGRWVVLQMKPEFTGKKTLRGIVTGCTDGILHCE
ncbi:MAG: ribosome maturation factor RimP, partial [Chitinispirillaceae bacterium]|nr:ribosome maturation factor RimP [Chitinispirillaceae bacterium]